MKKIIVLSTVALALILQGCGGSSSDSSNTPKNTVSDELKSFAKGLTDSNEITSVVKKTGSSQSSSSSDTTAKTKIQQKETLESCEDGGTIKVTSDIDFDMEDEAIAQMLSGGFEMNLATDDCIEDGVKSNGTLSLTVSGQELHTMTLAFVTDTTFEDLESAEVITVSKNSTMTVDEISDDTEQITESIKASSSTGKSYESINLVSRETMSINSDFSYEISGKIVRDGITYSVDEQYDGSKTPMVFENYEDLVSGTAKYYNESNHHIIMTVVGKNQIKISVDTDNDGDIDEEETVSI